MWVLLVPGEADEEQRAGGDGGGGLGEQAAVGVGAVPGD